MPRSLSALEKKIGVNFKSKDFLSEALTHRSFLNENPRQKLSHNERLEFLGDAVLELVVTENLYKNYPNPEGELTNWRAALVNSSMLNRIAKELDLDKFLLLSRGEAKDNGRGRQYIRANAVEALIGAIYLEKGYSEARKFIEKFVIAKLPEILKNKTYKDPKSCFQEYSQEVHKTTPIYKVLKEWGPDHDKSFSVGVFLGSELVAEGTGHSKQTAEEKAAQLALSRRLKGETSKDNK